MPAALALAGLVALLPGQGRADEAGPRVDLARISFGERAATAPLSDGETARLSIDVELQRAARRLLALAHPFEGAVLLVEASTGRILVWAETSREKRVPSELLTRARQPAASVFKLITTTALLEGRGVTPTTEVCTSGGTHGIERRHLDAPRKGRAVCAPFALALGHSRNAAYAQLATHHLSRQELIDVAERFGFNHSLPFEAPASVGKLVVPYSDLDFARTAAGFRGSTLSPIGAAHLALVISRGGRDARLRIVDEAPGFATPDAPTTMPRVTDKRTAERLRRMMEVTVREGTSAEAFTDDGGRPYLGSIRVAGKTGTLQRDKKQHTTSWFTGFAPSRRPEVVVSVLLVNGKVWRRKANEVARDMLRVYFASRGKRGITNPLADGAPAARVSALTEE